MKFISNYFEFDKNHTNFKTEILGGLTTFLTIAYILFVIPDILGQVGLPKESVFVATAVSAAIGTLIMGAYAKFPMVLAPGMGLNAFVAFSVIAGMQIPWQTALAGVFVSGFIFIIISATGLRELIIQVIPNDIKYAVSAGIGLFIAFIGLKNCGIIIANSSTYVALGEIKSRTVLVALFGLIAMAVLMVRGVKSAIFYGLVMTVIIGLLTGEVAYPKAVVSMPPSMKPTFLVALTHLKDVWNVDMLIVIFTLLFMDFFDTAGTLVAVGSKVGLIKEDGSVVRGSKALLADSVATCIGAVLGTTNTTSCMESLSGVAAGARTGFSSVVVSGLFLVSLFFSPLLSVVTSSISAPALIIVGSLLCTSLREIDWDDSVIAISAFITIILMPLTYSIGEGVAAGFLVYIILMIAKGRVKELHPVIYGLGVLFIAYFVLG